MSTEPGFYDVAMTGAGEPAMLPLDVSPWLGLYRTVADWIPAGHLVVDLGCGTGRFAELLRSRGHGCYVGVDFSRLTVAEAERYVPAADPDTGWDARFEVGDLRDWRPDDARPGNTTYVCLEVLEHLVDDVGLVRRVPVGHEFLFSVTNYGGAAHQRSFPNVGDVWDRYGHLLVFRGWSMVETGPRHAIHAFRAVRRVDAW